jgi:hypothetical protein
MVLEKKELLLRDSTQCYHLFLDFIRLSIGPRIQTIHLLLCFNEPANHAIQLGGGLDVVRVFRAPILRLDETQLRRGEMPKRATASGLRADKPLMLVAQKARLFFIRRFRRSETEQLRVALRQILSAARR